MTMEKAITNYNVAPKTSETLENINIDGTAYAAVDVDGRYFCYLSVADAHADSEETTSPTRVWSSFLTKYISAIAIETDDGLCWKEEVESGAFD